VYYVYGSGDVCMRLRYGVMEKKKCAERKNKEGVWWMWVVVGEDDRCPFEVRSRIESGEKEARRKLDKEEGRQAPYIIGRRAEF
jgi:hypothetical protein